MEGLIQMAGVPVITAMVYGAMAGYKLIVNGKENLVRIIPVIAVALGVVLGIIAFYAVSGIMPADNVFTAIIIGGASGLAATGGNQIFKQLTKGDTNDSGGKENGDDRKQD